MGILTAHPPRLLLGVCMVCRTHFSKLSSGVCVCWHASTAFAALCFCCAISVLLKAFTTSCPLVGCQGISWRGVTVFSMGWSKLPWPCHPNSEKVSVFRELKASHLAMREDMRSFQQVGRQEVSWLGKALGPKGKRPAQWCHFVWVLVIVFWSSFIFFISSGSNSKFLVPDFVLAMIQLVVRDVLPVGKWGISKRKSRQRLTVHG